MGVAYVKSKPTIGGAELPAASRWIDGNWVRSGKSAQGVDPATGEVIGQYFIGG